ncbi:MAG: SWIM zinc finger family protein [Sulfolobaceae archaeon]|nr:SWIM zinc finger family protein [Sulfolobaceae archaeon]
MVLVKLSSSSKYDVIVVHRDSEFILALVKSSSRNGYHFTQLYLKDGNSVLGYSCSCEDFMFRRRACKHVRLLINSLIKNEVDEDKKVNSVKYCNINCILSLSN